MFRAMLRYLPFIVLGLLLIAALASAVAFLLRQLDLLPPDSLRIAAGPPGSAYHASASAYRAVLARDDIDLQIIETRGSVDNAALIALVTRLVARDDLHPALVNRLVHAVLEVHRGGSIIPADRQYPAAVDLGVEPDDYATELLEKGFSPLEAVLPYWIVAQLYRVLLILLPALLLFLPLMRILPALYQWLYRRRVLRHYARVHDIDGRLMSERSSLGESDLRALRDELDAIERKLLQANLPNSYRKEAYTLLHHLDLVRRRSDEVLRDLA
jgi:hypothetical protein